MFWDSSALIPLAFTERSSADMVALAGKTRTLVVWWGSSVECAAAAHRRYRQSRGTPADLRAALQQVHDILTDAQVVPAVEAIRIRAERLVGSYPLGAADALQLAAGVDVVRGATVESAFRLS
jgi:predicted nucleic acid-binding protein